MNDKQQLAAMGVQYRLTEEQAKGLAERMPQTGALKILDDEPLCMANRIEELEAHVRVMADSLNSFREFAAANVWDDGEREAMLASIDAALAGKMLDHTEQPLAMVPEGWLLSRLPQATPSQKDGGWTLEFDFLDSITDEVLYKLGYGASLESVEGVLMIVDVMLAASHKLESK